MDIVLVAGFDVLDVIFKFVGVVLVSDVGFVDTVGCKMESLNEIKICVLK